MRWSNVGCGLLVALGINVAMPDRGWAQGEGASKVKLQMEWDKYSQQRNKLLAGEVQPGKGDMDVAHAIARYFILRFELDTEIPEKLHKEFTVMVNGTLERKENRKFIEDFLAPALVKSMKEVLDNVKNDRTRVIQVVMTLPTMARLTSKVKADPIGDYLIDLVKDDKTHDVIRLYALKGLKEMMPIAEQPSPLWLELDPKKNPEQNARRSRDAKYVDALRESIERPFDAASLTDEKLYSAKRYIRHYAIVALAQAGAPAVLALSSKDGKGPEALGPVAPTLLRVLAEPLPANASASIRALILKDKIEAALGLCNMKHYKDAAKNTEMAEYDPAIANYLIGLTLHEFASEYNKDLVNFTRKEADKRLPYIAWKTNAKRFELALKSFARAENPKSIELQVIVDLSVLPAIAKYLPVNAENLAKLERKAQELRPAAAAAKVFKTAPMPKAAPMIQLPPAN